MRYTISLFFAAALMAPAQVVSFGIKAGVPMTQASPHRFAGEAIDTGRWTVGPTIEVRLVHNFSLEADALYHSYSSQNRSSFTDPDYGLMFSSIRSDTKAWDLPLLLKYRFLSGSWRPFVDGGYAVSYESNDVTAILTCYTSGTLCNASSTYQGLGTPSTFGYSGFRRGPSAGAGVEFRFGKVKIAPEIRYTRIDNPNTNQATAMVGFSF